MLKHRITVALLALLAASAVPAQAPDTLHQIAPAAVAPSTLNMAPPADTSAVRAALPHSNRPAPSTRLPVELMAFAGMAAAKKKTRRTAGKRGELAMYLDSHVDVQRDGDDGKKVTQRIAGGVLVDDTDLTDDEIDELTARRVIRPATAEEIARLEQADVDDERTQLQAEQAKELEALRADQAAELAAAPEAKRAALQEKHQKAVDALTEKHVTAVNKIGS